ncbi:NAD-dependent succinate-semialdehyde dehydrogenase [Vibrio vulnificus]|uniref:NAD-dependent succinate-semialdehyde dehydrogenase n=1 Tax=Vibrio vulnificus TaxID=672 RepID=UPI0009B6BDB1|nr:NAD-dependent succinate-semialdehyde dehydrogenase [Vibrio vulnificus]EGR0207938.1 NAD-dependent succinate-semialdehyde dehydrogenase [Vibrio vulnificus]EHI9272034.1 NAD-dependent succinate-semialdehyde dehydrogenase [Vibrio vulnificus]EHU4928302.1 NAD-dependent succinate-semialdehyde dehydrogenase [Vibrio vulnificus]EIT7021866.1 NAD-dependent succinate-semialdehyde dehydrogenase [Vibrio vulnificus]EIV8621323.1 NAD-dependent succinate-semialdehyde dehydrogenase [Vibrio vulnificus]
MNLNYPELFQQRCYIDGQWVAESGQTQAVTNPSTGKVIGEIPVFGELKAKECITAAQAAFELWRKTTADYRADVLRRWYELMMLNIDDLAAILTLEQGKPFTEAKGEITYAASFVQWYSEEARRAYGEIIPSHRENGKIVVTKEPIGVVAAITPWNFPAAMITRKAAPAFAAGCSMVLKPAQETPFTALALAKLAEDAGLPKGLFNVITGDARAIGGVFTSDKRVRKVSFTGSTNVGKILMNQSASTIKKLALELGGNAPFIVFEDADIDAAVEGAMIAKFRNAGQTCVCANRLFVHDAVYDEFAEKLADRVKQLKVGDGFADDVAIGPLINSSSVAKVQEHVDDAVAKGAKVLCGGLLNDEQLFVAPYVLTNMSDDMLVAEEETFGPVAPLFRFKDEAEVLERANDTESGLAGYFYTRSLGRAWRVADALEVGMVGINEGLISTAAAPFGGIKESGLGREGSRHGMDEYMEMKYMLMGGLDS